MTNLNYMFIVVLSYSLKNVANFRVQVIGKILRFIT